MRVVREYNLPSGWINADVMHSDSFSMNLFNNAQYKVYNICMKLVSFRPKDLIDLNKIGSRLKRNKVTRQMVLYGNLYLLKDK